MLLVPGRPSGPPYLHSVYKTLNFEYSTHKLSKCEEKGEVIFLSSGTLIFFLLTVLIQYRQLQNIGHKSHVIILTIQKEFLTLCLTRPKKIIGKRLGLFMHR